MRKFKKLPSRFQLLEKFTYDPKSGDLFNKKGKKVGWKDSVGYINVYYNRVPYKAHRIIYKIFHGKDPGRKVIDHRDGDKSNNAIENLRCVSHATNIKNTQTKRDQEGLPPSENPDTDKDPFLEMLDEFDF